jgi:DedD protein
VNDILKQRLVGALILLALGVVFWPIIFVEPDEKKLAEQQIPSPPEVSTADIESPDAAGLRGSPELVAKSDSLGAEPVVVDALPDSASESGEDTVSPAPTESAASTVPSAATPAPGNVRSEPPQRLAVDTDGVPVAWTLQVATVSSKEKAEHLRQQLLEMKQEVYVTEVRSGGKSLYRVCIGPKFERAALEKLQAGINARFGVTSIVARYLP